MASEIKMSNILYLHSPDQVPYGKLSPLYREKLKIDQEEASNIISYCYAGLLKKGGRRNGILLENGKEARIEALKYFREEKDELYNETMYNGLFQKIKQNPQAKQILLESGNSIIVYQSENVFLGVNSKGEGQNRIGSMLMKIRTVIQKEVKEENERKLRELIQLGKYNIYIVHKSLSERIQKGIDDLSKYIGKIPDEIIKMLNLPPFPGSFNVVFPEQLNYFLLHPTSIAQTLRNEYSEEYNEAILNLQKRDILTEFLIKNTLKELPPNHKELYNRYKELKEKMEFKEEYESLSKIFRPVVSEINSFIQSLGDKIYELEDRLYFLASNNMLNGIKVTQKPLIVVSQDYIEKQQKLREEEQTKLIKLLKEYKQSQQVDDEESLKKKREEIEKQKIAYREAEEAFYQSEKKYMKEAAKIAEKEHLKRQGFDEDEEVDDSDDDTDDDSDDDSDDEDSIPVKIQKLQEKYKKNYKQIYDMVQDAKRYLKDKDEAEKLLKEYSKKHQKRPFVWKRPFGEAQYVLTENQEMLLDDAMKEIIPIPDVKLKAYNKDKKKKKKLEQQLEKMSKKERYLYSKQDIFDIFLKYASKDEELKKIPVIIDSMLGGDSEKKMGNIYSFSDNNPLSPSYIDMLEINNFIFPNVYYYIYFVLFMHISPVKDQVMIKSHNILLVDPSQYSRNLENFKPIDFLIGLYSNTENIYISDKLTKRAQKALYEKFKYSPSSPKENLSLYNKLLISTDPKLLIYGDKDDAILGTSKENPGLNIIGRIMSDIRQELLSKYGPVKVDNLLEELPKRVDRKHPISDFIFDKTREMLYVLSIYVDYIKNTDTIKDEDVSFVIDNLYSNCFFKIKKIQDVIKTIPNMPPSFEKDSTEFLRSSNYTISKSSLQKLWSYLYVLNELFHLEILDNNIDLLQPKKIGSFGKSVDYADDNWFISSVQKIRKSFGGDIEISLGVNYKKDDKIRSLQINKKNISQFKEDKLNEYYNNTIMKLLTILNESTESITDVFVTVYETPISIIRQNYIKEKQKACNSLISIDPENKDQEEKISCVLDSFISILKKLKKKNLITDNIEDSTLLFINRLLSTSGSIKIALNTDIIKVENKDDLYESLLSQSIHNKFKEKGFDIKNIDKAVLLLKNIAFNPNYTNVMARVLSFSDKKVEEDISVEEVKGLFKEREKTSKKKKKAFYEEEDEEAEGGEDEGEESEGEEGYDIDRDLADYEEEEESDGEEELLTDGNEYSS